MTFWDTKKLKAQNFQRQCQFLCLWHQVDFDSGWHSDKRQKQREREKYRRDRKRVRGKRRVWNTERERMSEWRQKFSPSFAFYLRLISKVDWTAKAAGSNFSAQDALTVKICHDKTQTGFFQFCKMCFLKCLSDSVLVEVTGSIPEMPAIPQRRRVVFVLGTVNQFAF